MIAVFKRDGIWPPIVPSVVLVETLTGRQRADALTNRFLKTCDIVEDVRPAPRSPRGCAADLGPTRIRGRCDCRGDSRTGRHRAERGRGGSSGAGFLRQRRGGAPGVTVGPLRVVSTVVEDLSQHVGHRPVG